MGGVHISFTLLLISESQLVQDLRFSPLRETLLSPRRTET